MCPLWVLDGWIWWFSSWILISIDFFLWLCHLFPTIQFSEVFASCPCWILLLHFSFHLSSVMSHQCLFPRFLFEIPLPYVLTYHLPFISPWSHRWAFFDYRLSILWRPAFLSCWLRPWACWSSGIDVIRSLVVSTFVLISVDWLGNFGRFGNSVWSRSFVSARWAQMPVRPVMLAWMLGRCMLQRKCSRPSRLPQHTETSQALQSSSQEMKDVQIFSRFA